MSGHLRKQHYEIWNEQSHRDGPDAHRISPVGSSHRQQLNTMTACRYLPQTWPPLNFSKPAGKIAEVPDNAGL
jgi:hypothetical protein